MSDRAEEQIRRPATLKADSERLVAASGRLAKTRPKGTLEQREEQRPPPAAAETRGEDTGNIPVAQPGPGILDEDEAVALAMLLEELAARPGPDPLSGPALQAAALLRWRVAAGQRRDTRPRPGDPAARREIGDSRDGTADDRDAQAMQRDARAAERDDQATERDRQSAAADEKAAASDQRIRGRLRAAEPREKTAAERAAVPPPASEEAERQQWQLDEELTGADQTPDREDREAIQEILAQARAARQAALHDRYDASQDRVAARRDRHAAQTDRQDAARDRDASRADRDQSVIESEEEDPAPRN